MKKILSVLFILISLNLFAFVNNIHNAFDNKFSQLIPYQQGWNGYYFNYGYMEHDDYLGLYGTGYMQLTYNPYYYTFEMKGLNSTGALTNSVTREAEKLFKTIYDIKYFVAPQTYLYFSLDNQPLHAKEKMTESSANLIQDNVLTDYEANFFFYDSSNPIFNGKNEGADYNFLYANRGEGYEFTPVIDDNLKTTLGISKDLSFLRLKVLGVYEKYKLPYLYEKITYKNNISTSSDDVTKYRFFRDRWGKLYNEDYLKDTYGIQSGYQLNLFNTIFWGDANLRYEIINSTKYATSTDGSGDKIITYSEAKNRTYSNSGNNINYSFLIGSDIKGNDIPFLGKLSFVPSFYIYQNFGNITQIDIPSNTTNDQSKILSYNKDYSYNASLSMFSQNLDARFDGHITYSMNNSYRKELNSAGSVINYKENVVYRGYENPVFEGEALISKRITSGELSFIPKLQFNYNYERKYGTGYDTNMSLITDNEIKYKWFQEDNSTIKPSKNKAYDEMKLKYLGELGIIYAKNDYKIGMFVSGYLKDQQLTSYNYNENNPTSKIEKVSTDYGWGIDTSSRFFIEAMVNPNFTINFYTYIYNKNDYISEEKYITSGTYKNSSSDFNAEYYKSNMEINFSLYFIYIFR